MIDVTFLILFFFLCTLQFKTLEGKLQAFLPKDVGISCRMEVPTERVDVRIDVLAPGDDELLGRRLSYTIGPRQASSLPQAAAWLRKLHRDDPERRFVLQPRPGTVYDDVVAVLDAMLVAGITEVRVAGQER